MSKKGENFLYVSLERFEGFETKVESHMEKAALHNSRAILSTNLINRYNGDLLQFVEDLLNHECRLDGIDTRLNGFFGRLLQVEGDLNAVERDAISFKRMEKKLSDGQRMVASHTAIVRTHVLAQNALNSDLQDRIEALEAIIKAQAEKIQRLELASVPYQLMDLRFEPIMPAVPLSEKPRVLRLGEG